jgi:pantetheine-phosphate adenylyltransferase
MLSLLLPLILSIEPMTKVAVYPGTFDPMTKGHLDIIRRSARVFDNLTVAVAENCQKKPLIPHADRLTCVRDACKDIANVEVLGFSELLCHFMEKHSINTVIKGLRPTGDLDNEFIQFTINKRMLQPFETFFLLSSEDNLVTSSSMVRELLKYGADISPFVPDSVVEYFKNKR